MSRLICTLSLFIVCKRPCSYIVIIVSNTLPERTTTTTTWKIESLFVVVMWWEIMPMPMVFSDLQRSVKKGVVWSSSTSTREIRSTVVFTYNTCRVLGCTMITTLSWISQLQSILTYVLEKENRTKMQYLKGWNDVYVTFDVN